MKRKIYKGKWVLGHEFLDDDELEYLRYKYDMEWVTDACNACLLVPTAFFEEDEDDDHPLWPQIRDKVRKLPSKVTFIDLKD